MSAVADNAVVADEPVSNGHQIHDGPNAFETSGKLVTDREVVDVATNGVQDFALDAEDVAATGHKNDDSLVTDSSDDTLAAETFVEILNVSKLVDDMELEAPVLHTSASDKENTTLIHDSEPLANGEHKYPVIEASEQLATLTIVPGDKPASLAEPFQEDANIVSGTVISEISKDELPTTPSTETQIPFVDVDTTVVGALEASSGDEEPPINSSMGPETSLSDAVELSINGVGSTTDAEPSHCQEETPSRDPNTEINPTADILEEVVVLPAVEVEDIPMAAEPEPAVVEDACEPIGAEASPTEVDISSAGEEPAVIETVNPASIESAAEATPEGEYIPVEPELALVEAESVPVETHNSPAEPESTPPTLEAAPIDSTLGEVIVEETPAVSEPDAQPAATLEPTTKVAEPEPLEDTAGAVEPIAEAAESGPAEEIAPVAEAVVPVETSGAEAEESAAEVDAPVASEEEPNEAPQGAIEAENKPAPPTELEVDAFVPELVFIPTEAATEPVVSTEPEEAVIALNMEPEVPVESLIAAEGESVTADDSITADSNPVTVPDPEPVATTETDPVAVAEPEPAAIEPEAPTALDPEPTEPEAESTVVETFPIDVEPPSSNASFVEDPEVNFTYDDEPQTPVAKETPAFEQPALDAESEAQVEESPVEETVQVEDVIPVEVATPEEPASVEEVLAIEESPVEETLPVEETIPVKETIPCEEVVAVDDVAPTGEPAPVEEVPSAEAVAAEESAPVEETTPVEDFTPIESAAPIESPPPVEEAVVDEAEPTVEEPAAHVDELEAPVDDAPVLEETLPSVDAAGIEEPLPAVEVPSPAEEPAPSTEEPLVATEESFVEEVTAATDEISPAGDVSTVEETSVLPVEARVGEDVPAVEEHSAAEVEESESVTAEESSAAVEEHEPVAVEDTLVSEDQPVEETPVNAEEPVSADDQIPPTMDGTPLVAEASSDADMPALEATLAAEEETVTALHEPSAVEALPTTVEPIVVLEETKVAVAAPVEEDVLVVEEPPAPSEVEEPEPATPEEAPAPTGEHEFVAVEDTPVPDDQPVAILETPATEEAFVSVDGEIPPVMNETPLVAEESSAVDEPALDEIPTTEESPAPEEESATASTVEVPPTAGEPAAVPEETTSTPEETAPVFEAAPVTPAEPMLEVASSLEGTAIVVDESTVESDAPVAEQPVVVEETAPVASEALVVEMVATEDVHATLELAEEAFTTSEETKDGLEGSQYAEASVSLPEQHADVPFIEESLPTAPIVEEFTSVTAEQPEVLEEQPVVASQVPVSGEHSEVGEDSEPLNAPVETSSEIEETEGVEQFETVAVEEVAEQQELATTPALDVAADIERPKSPWTSSYSVITQGPGVPVEEPASTYEGDDDVVPAQAQTPEIIVDEVDTIVPETAEVSGQSQVEAVVTVHLAEEQVVLGELEESHPKSPWTPSYSVTVQGSAAPTDEGLDDLEQLPSSAAQPVAAEGVEEQPVPFIEETLISGEVSSSTTVVTDTHVTLSAMLDESVEPGVPDPVVEAEAPQDVSLGQGVIVQPETSVPSPSEPGTVEEESDEEVEHGSFIVEDESTQLGATEPVEERSRSPWTPSYSVTGLEPASALVDQAVAKEDELVDHGSFITETTQPSVVIADAPEVELASELLTPVDDPVGERPKSPWTPSYSVTKQGPNDAVEETEELDGLAQLAAPVATTPAPAADEEPIPPVLITETRASVDEPVMAEAPSEHEDAVTASELSESDGDVEFSGTSIAREIPQTFPIVEESQKIAKKPSLSAVDELNAAEVTESSALRIDIPTTNGANRKRLESTTSSRFFPGGWFSSSPKVPEEGRTSLDVAAGEFIHKFSVENTPTTAPTTALPSAVEEDTEKKSRWCTIM